MELCEATCRGLVHPMLRVSCRHDIFHTDPNFAGVTKGRCWHIFGFDVLVCNDLSCYLLELNARPSFSIRGDKHVIEGETCYSVSAVDKKVKVRTLGGAVHIVLSAPRNVDAEANYCTIQQSLPTQLVTVFNEAWMTKTKCEPVNFGTIEMLFSKFLNSLGRKSVRHAIIPRNLREVDTEWKQYKQGS